MNNLILIILSASKPVIYENTETCQLQSENGKKNSELTFFCIYFLRYTYFLKLYLISNLNAYFQIQGVSFPFTDLKIHELLS